MLFGSRESFESRRCPRCGVLWLPWPPADLARHYPPQYYARPGGGDAAPAPLAPSPDSPAGGFTGRFAAWARRQRDAIELFGPRPGDGLRRLLAAPPGPEVRAVRALVRAAGLRSFDDPILDVGSGPVPERLQQLGAAGFRRLEGIDPMLPADAGVPGIPVRRWTIEEVTGRYALVTFHHSFEHVPEPRATMAAAAAILRPGGTVLIRTPVMGSWFWDRFGVSWWELDAPRHLYVHTAASLRHLAAEVGLTLVHVTHESSFLEILASDQIARDIPWRDPRSYWSAPPGTFGPAAIAEARETARRINEEGRAGRAAFYFRGAS